MFPGLPSRLEREIKQLYLQRILKGDVEKLSKFKIRIVDSPKRNDIVFQGASVLGEFIIIFEQCLKSDLKLSNKYLLINPKKTKGNAMKDNDNFWITKQYYEEVGLDRAVQIESMKRYT